MNKIPITIGVDNAYILPACVVIISLEENKNIDTEYVYYLFCSEKLNNASKCQLERLKKRYTNIKLDVICTPEKMLLGAKMGSLGDYATIAAYLRLFLPYLLENIDKCIYLDADIIVCDDLSELFYIDVENVYLAGVRDFVTSTTKVDERKKKLQIETMNDYLYSGVLLMNLKKIRNDFADEVFYEDMKIGYPLQEQDIINKRFFGKTKKIQLKYNFINRYLHRPDLLSEEVYNINDINEAVEHPVIIHFPGERKPWIFRKSKGSAKWWEYADSFLNDEEKSTYQEIQNNYLKLLDFENILAACGGRVVIWGCGKDGKVLAERLKNKDVMIVAWGDNNKKLQGGLVDNIPVVGRNGLSELEYDSIIITCHGYVQIKKELLELNIPEKRIMRYIDKNDVYYASLTPEWYEREVRQ